MIIETTNYTVVYCSKRKSKVRWKYKKKIQEENTRQGKKVKSKWSMSKKEKNYWSYSF